MKTFLCALMLLLGLPGLRAGETFAHLDDTGLLLASEPDWMLRCETGLAEFESKRGIKILVRYHLKSPSEAEDKKPGAYMHALAQKLGVDRAGVLVVYFHDDPDWRVWIGDELANLFTGKPGTVQELTASEAIHNVKEAMLTAAHAQAEQAMVRAQEAAPEKKPLTVSQRLVIQTDILLEALKAKFAAK